MATGRKPNYRLLGQNFGLLTVQEYAGDGLWKCLCCCGNVTLVDHYRLVKKKTKSCGCVRTEWQCTHRATKTPEYNVFRMMHQRCSNPNYNRYYDYGGRGITIGDRWSGENGFQNFLSDMGKRPSLIHKLDRRNNDGPYSPDNCRWATPMEQQRNMRSNVMLTYHGETMCLKDWAKRLGIKPRTLSYRVKHWDIERAFTARIQRQELR